MPRYNTEFDPPAPMVDFTVYCPVDHGRASIRGELDSGAEISVVPQRLVDELHLVPRRMMITKGYDGTQNRWATYMVDLETDDIHHSQPMTSDIYPGLDSADF